MAHRDATSTTPVGTANFRARDKNPATYRRGFGIRAKINGAIPMNNASAVDICLGSAGYCQASSETTSTNRNAYVDLAKNKCARRSILALTLLPSASTCGSRELR